ncbi:mucin-19-like isoform X2 [Sycon ciliatum]
MEEKWLQAARSRNLEKRQSTIAAEKERSRRVASKPLKADTQLSDLLSASSSVVVGSVCSTKAPHGPTYHHLTAHAVQAQGDARNAMLDAENVENEQEVAQQLKDRSRHERVEVARVRHEHALQHVRLKRNYEEQLEELETMRKVDSLQRRKQVEHVPKHLFVTPLMRLEQQQAEEEELQRRVEAMCLNRIPSTTTTGVANSITTAVPQTYHSTSTASADSVTTTLTDSVTPELSCSTLSSSAISESDVTGMQPPDGAASAHRQHAGAPVSSASSQSQPLSRLLEHVRSQQQGRRAQLGSEQVESPPAHTSARSAPAAVRGLGALPVTSSIADEHPVPSTRNIVPTRSKPTNFSQPVTSHSALSTASAAAAAGTAVTASHVQHTAVSDDDYSSSTLSTSSSLSHSTLSQHAGLSTAPPEETIAQPNPRYISSAGMLHSQAQSLQHQPPAFVPSTAFPDNPTPSICSSCARDGLSAASISSGAVAPSPIPADGALQSAMAGQAPAVPAAGGGQPTYVLVTTPSVLTLHRLPAMDSSASLASLSGGVGLPVGHPPTQPVALGHHSLPPNPTAAVTVTASDYADPGQSTCVSAATQSTAMTVPNVNSAFQSPSPPPQLLPGWEETQAQLAMYRQSQQELLEQFRVNMAQLQQQQMSLSLMMNSSSQQASPCSQLSSSRSSNESPQLLPPSSHMPLTSRQRASASPMISPSFLHSPQSHLSDTSQQSDTSPDILRNRQVCSVSDVATETDLSIQSTASTFPASSSHTSRSTSSHSSSGPPSSAQPLSVTASALYVDSVRLLQELSFTPATATTTSTVSSESTNDDTEQSQADPRPVDVHPVLDTRPVLSVIVEEPSILSSSTSSLSSVCSPPASPRRAASHVATDKQSDSPTAASIAVDSSMSVACADSTLTNTDTDSSTSLSQPYEAQLAALLARLRQVQAELPPPISAASLSQSSLSPLPAQKAADPTATSAHSKPSLGASDAIPTCTSSLGPPVAQSTAYSSQLRSSTTGVLGPPQAHSTAQSNMASGMPAGDSSTGINTPSAITSSASVAVLRGPLSSNVSIATGTLAPALSRSKTTYSTAIARAPSTSANALLSGLLSSAGIDTIASTVSLGPPIGQSTANSATGSTGIAAGRLGPPRAQSTAHSTLGTHLTSDKAPRLGANLLSDLSTVSTSDLDMAYNMTSSADSALLPASTAATPSPAGPRVSSGVLFGHTALPPAHTAASAMDGHLVPGAAPTSAHHVSSPISSAAAAPIPLALVRPSAHAAGGGSGGIQSVPNPVTAIRHASLSGRRSLDFNTRSTNAADIPMPPRSSHATAAYSAGAIMTTAGVSSSGGGGGGGGDGGLSSSAPLSVVSISSSLTYSDYSSSTGDAATTEPAQPAARQPVARAPMVNIALGDFSSDTLADHQIGSAPLDSTTTAARKDVNVSSAPRSSQLSNESDAASRPGRVTPSLLGVSTGGGGAGDGGDEVSFDSPLRGYPSHQQPWNSRVFELVQSTPVSDSSSSSSSSATESFLQAVAPLSPLKGKLASSPGAILDSALAVDSVTAGQQSAAPKPLPAQDTSSSSTDSMADCSRGDDESESLTTSTPAAAQSRKPTAFTVPLSNDAATNQKSQAYSAVSLQASFQQRRQDFMKSSAERLQAIKQPAASSKPRPVRKQDLHRSSSLGTTTRSGPMESAAADSDRHVRFASPLQEFFSSPLGSFSDQRSPVTPEEMKARTQRLWHGLEENRGKKADELKREEAKLRQQRVKELQKKIDASRSRKMAGQGKPRIHAHPLPPKNLQDMTVSSKPWK